MEAWGAGHHRTRTPARGAAIRGGGIFPRMTTTPSARPFHYSFYVRDLDEARRFYGTLLGCREGRSTATWVDFDFFGNQISCHLAEAVPATRDTGKVDDVLVPMPHFGAVLAW